MWKSCSFIELQAVGHNNSLRAHFSLGAMTLMVAGKNSRGSVSSRGHLKSNLTQGYWSPQSLDESYLSVSPRAWYRPVSTIFKNNTASHHKLELYGWEWDLNDAYYGLQCWVRAGRHCWKHQVSYCSPSKYHVMQRTVWSLYEMLCKGIIENYINSCGQR